MLCASSEHRLSLYSVQYDARHHDYLLEFLNAYANACSAVDGEVASSAFISSYSLRRCIIFIQFILLFSACTHVCYMYLCTYILYTQYVHMEYIRVCVLILKERAYINIFE